MGSPLLGQHDLRQGMSSFQKFIFTIFIFISNSFLYFILILILYIFILISFVSRVLQVYSEFKDNLATARQLFNNDLTTPPNFNRVSAITPSISGLYNGNALKALYDLGYRNLVSMSLFCSYPSPLTSRSPSYFSTSFFSYSLG